MLAVLVLALLPYASTFSPNAVPFGLPARATVTSPEVVNVFARRLPFSAACRSQVSRMAAGSIDKDFGRALDTAVELVRGLRSRTPHDEELPLNLETDFYDPSTGLHSEGVWHNALVGMACLGLTFSDCATEGVGEAPRAIAASLWKHSWDGVSFRRRAHSGRWDHSALDDPTSGVTQPEYYKASDEYRCVQHGMACMFWSCLKEVDPGARQEFGAIASAFIEQFWDEEAAQWTTISRTQGVATGSRPSASTGKSGPPNGRSSAAGESFFEEVGGLDQVYYRAVDHAVALLALLSMDKRWQQGDPIPRERLHDLIRLTAQQLLSPAGFGYGGDYSVADPNPWTRTYIGLDRRRNFWHDGWVVLALARTREFAEDIVGVGEEEIKSLLTQLAGIYGAPDGTIWHWSLDQRKPEDNVRYCGNNALLYAICSELQWAPEPQGGKGGDGEPPSRTQERINFKKFQRAFWDFLEELRSRDESICRLASVGDVYRQVRLHPNSELAALLLWKLF